MYSSCHVSVSGKDLLEDITSIGPVSYTHLDVYKRQILYDRVDERSHCAAGTLFFSDGSSVTVNLIPNDGAPRVVEFDTRKTEWIRFQMPDGEGHDLGLSEIEVYPCLLYTSRCV